MPPPAIWSDQERNDFAAKIRAGDRRSLARAITMIESDRTDHRQNGENLVNYLLNNHDHSVTSLRLGITGPPGAGKSSFIEAFGLYALQHSHRIGVVAIDPSLWRSGGSILGDKTRMELLSREENVFIRPAPSRGEIGGVTSHTSAIIALLEAASYDLIIIETVGVGQSEMEIANLADCLMLILPPAAGDELQGIKGGILERADLILINKADGELAGAAQIALAEYRAALRLLRIHRHDTQDDGEIMVLPVSAKTGYNLPQTYDAIMEFHQKSLHRGKNPAAAPRRLCTCSILPSTAHGG